jgi:hypothetical protein
MNCLLRMISAEWFRYLDTYLGSSEAGLELDSTPFCWLEPFTKSREKHGS